MALPVRSSSYDTNRIELSVVVISFNMRREIPRTLYSLSVPYQKNMRREEYEVILVDNGSEQPWIHRELAGINANLNIINLETNAAPSPARAINRGLQEARGNLVGVMIDGARMVTPGLLDACRGAARLHPRAVVSTLGFHLGREPQYIAVSNGYTQEVEDRLLESIAWPEDGYRLFEIAVFAASSRRGWLLPVSESNALFTTRELWLELGGYEERFESAGGGLVNLDTYGRAAALPDVRLVCVLGEGSFHQIHGGIATNSLSPPADQWHAEYQRIRGCDYQDSTIAPTLFGSLPRSALAHMERSLQSASQAMGEDLTIGHVGYERLAVSNASPRSSKTSIDPRTNSIEHPVDQPPGAALDCPVNAGTVVFILSADRSGSTWLAYVLGSTPDAAFLGEFRRAWNEELRRKCAWCSANGRQACEVLAGIEQYPADRAYELAFTRTRKRFLIDSSKRTTWAEQFIAPDSHFKVQLIHLIRDPRGWYASEDRRRPESGIQMVGEWVRENLHIRNFVQLSNVPSVTVFYEDLASSPAPAVQQLCSEIGCKFEASALRYWEKPHHGFAANGASSPLLSSTPKFSESINFFTGDNRFYETNYRKSFVDQRWKERLSEADALAIGEDPRIAAFLNLYDRVLTANALHHLTAEDRSLHRHFEGKFVRAAGNTPQLEKVYLVRAGIRHWVTSSEFIKRVSDDWPDGLKIIPIGDLERIPIGSPVRG